MNGNNHNIAKSAFLVTLMMLCFKAIGFVKQAFVAFYYGATFETDVFFIAWGFVEGMSEAIVRALTVSIVAIYTMLRINKGNREADKLINGLLEIVLPFFFFFILFILILAPDISHVLAPSYDLGSLNKLTSFIKLLAPVFLFGALELVFSPLLDSHKSFYVPRLQSFIYSIVVIVACGVFSKKYGISALVVAQYVSKALFIFLLFLAARHYHKFFLVKFSEIPELKNILFTAVPLFIGNSVLQINQIVDKVITSGLGEGTTSALAYCHTLEQFVTNIMIVNIGNVMFANFAELVAKKELDQIKGALSKAINLLICLLFAISIITIIFAKEIVSIVYYRGSFTYDAVVLTSMALIGYSISFVAAAVRDLSIKSLYAFKDSKHPMQASIIAIVINIFFSLLLSNYMGILGISLATSISVLVGMYLNALFLKRYLTDYSYFIHLRTLIRCIPGGISLSIVCMTIKKNLDFSIIFKFGFSSIIGFIVYFTILYICNVKEIRELIYIIKRKIKLYYT